MSLVFGNEVDPQKAIRELARAQEKTAETVNALLAVVMAMAEKTPPDSDRIKVLCGQLSMFGVGISRHRIETLALKIASGGKSSA